MIEIVKQELAVLFPMLKSRDKTNLKSLYAVASLYESFRDALAWGPAEYYQQAAVLTGRAISNISHDIMSLPGVKRLNESSMQDFSGRGIFFFGHRAGLCNRLRAIASLSFIAKEIGCEFGFSWSETEACNGGVLPNKKFADKISPVLKNMDLSFDHFIFEDNPASAWYFYEIFKKLGVFSSWPEFHAGYINESKMLLDSMLVKLGCLNYLEEFITANSLNSYVALHVRRTDFVPYFAKRFPNEKLPEILDFINYVKEHCVGKKIFLSTDDIDVKAMFASEFGEDVCVLNFEFDKTQLRQTSFEHSLLDLALLSRSEELVVTPRSSFSEYAASISNAKIIKLWESK